MPEDENHEIKKLEFLANRSKQILETQTIFYRQKLSNAGVVVGVSALFIPFFMNGLKDSSTQILLLSILPVVLFVSAILLMLYNFFSRILNQGIGFKGIENAKEMTYSETLLKDIQLNKDSEGKNIKTMKRHTKCYDWAIGLTMSAIITSSIILITDKFSKRDQKKECTECINIFLNEHRNDPPFLMENRDMYFSEKTCVINNNLYERRDPKKPCKSTKRPRKKSSEEKNTNGQP